MDQTIQAERVTAWHPKNRKLRNLHSRKPYKCCDCARHFGSESAALRHWRDSHGRKA